MEPVAIFFIFGLFVFVSIVIRLMAGSLDGERVEHYVRQNGWDLIDRSWDPLGPGWFGEKDARIYQIVYRDKLGNVHRAHVKTSMLSGVYLTNDRIVEAAEPKPSSQSDASLVEENERLKRRIKELENRDA